jgi:hypothetical protein
MYTAFICTSIMQAFNRYYNARKYNYVIVALFMYIKHEPAYSL